MKNTITNKDRRRIYEDAISVVNNAQKMAEMAGGKNRALDRNIKAQIDSADSILYADLNYAGIDRAVFRNKVVPNLPKNRELRETLWKAAINDDDAAREKLCAIINELED